MDKEKKIQTYKDEIARWLVRAAWAYQSNQDALSKVALDNRWNLQKELAVLEGTVAPEKPGDPSEVFSELDRNEPDIGGDDRFQPSKVPRRPFPTTGGAEIALPLPEDDSEPGIE